MRYKVGDKIALLDDGQIGIIECLNNAKTKYGLLDIDYWWDDSEIDHEATAKLTLPQPSKDMLRSGMKVVERCGKESYCLVEIERTFDRLSNIRFLLDGFKNDLICNHKDNDIMQIWNGDTLIAQRTEKSEAELKKEPLEKQISECSDKIKNLYVCIENLELEIKSL